MGEAKNIFATATYRSCPVCHGKRKNTVGESIFDCICIEPDLSAARQALALITPRQMAFLRYYEHTLAKQPVTREEYDLHKIEFYVDLGDGEWDIEFDRELVPTTKIWFASGEHQMGCAGEISFIRYNTMGLLLRKCLMSGADASVPPDDSPDA